MWDVDKRAQEKYQQKFFALITLNFTWSKSSGVGGSALIVSLVITLTQSLKQYYYRVTNFTINTPTGSNGISRKLISPIHCFYLLRYIKNFFSVLYFTYILFSLNSCDCDILYFSLSLAIFSKSSLMYCITIHFHTIVWIRYV